MEKPQKKPENFYGLQAADVFAVAIEMGFIIALPIIVLGLIGKHFDQVHHTHVFVYLAIVLALLSSVIWLYRRFQAMVEKLQKASEQRASQRKAEDNPQQQQDNK